MFGGQDAYNRAVNSQVLASRRGKPPSLDMVGMATLEVKRTQISQAEPRDQVHTPHWEASMLSPSWHSPSWGALRLFCGALGCH